jgi:hypothetical protein
MPTIFDECKDRTKISTVSRNSWFLLTRASGGQGGGRALRSLSQNHASAASCLVNAGMVIGLARSDASRRQRNASTPQIAPL